MQRNNSQSLQRVRQAISEIKEELQNIQGNSPSGKARIWAGKGNFQLDLLTSYAEKAIMKHDLKQFSNEENQQQANNGQRSQTQYRQQREGQLTN